MFAPITPPSLAWNHWQAHHALYRSSSPIASILPSAAHKNADSLSFSSAPDDESLSPVHPPPPSSAAASKPACQRGRLLSAPVSPSLFYPRTPHLTPGPAGFLWLCSGQRRQHLAPAVSRAQPHLRSVRVTSQHRSSVRPHRSTTTIPPPPLPPPRHLPAGLSLFPLFIGGLK